MVGNVSKWQWANAVHNLESDISDIRCIHSCRLHTVRNVFRGFYCNISGCAKTSETAIFLVFWHPFILLKSKRLLSSHQRFTTFLTVTLSLFVGLVILVARLGSAWHVSSTNIVAPYRSFSREKLPGTVGAYIGLNHVNITMKGIGSPPFHREYPHITRYISSTGDWQLVCPWYWF